MLHTFRDLSRFYAQIGDETYPISDVFFAQGDWTLRYLAIDTGGWFDSDIVLVGGGLIDHVDTDGRCVVLNTSAAQLEAAPRWHDADETALLHAMPPIVIGPFGGTHSPLMVAAQMAPPPASNSTLAETAGEAIAARLERFDRWSGVEVFGADGQMGTLMDFLIDMDTKSITHLILDTGTILAGRQVVIPIDVVRTFAAQRTHIVLNATQEMLEDAPQLEALDQIDRTWFDALRSYYHLPV